MEMQHVDIAHINAIALRLSQQHKLYVETWDTGVDPVSAAESDSPVFEDVDEFAQYLLDTPLFAAQFEDYSEAEIYHALVCAEELGGGAYDQSNCLCDD